MVLWLRSNVVSPKSIANVLNVTRPAISPDGSNTRPCGNSLNAPLLSLYSSSTPPRFTASTLSKLVDPFSIEPRSLAVSQVTSASTAPEIVSVNGYN